MGRVADSQSDETCRVVYRGRTVDAVVTPTVRGDLLRALETGALCRLRTAEAMLAAAEGLSPETEARLSMLAEDLN